MRNTQAFMNQRHAGFIGLPCVPSSLLESTVAKRAYDAKQEWNVQGVSV